jgi:cell division protein FtsQ
VSSPGITDATIRLQVKRQDSRRRRLIRLGIGVAAGAILIALVWLLAFSPALSARAVRVTGVKVLTRAQVLDAAAVTLGTPLVWVDPGAVADRVAGLPPVDSVRVVRSWPNAVAIEVTERKPRLAIAYGSGYLLADAKGVVFRAVGHPPPGLIRVDGDPDDQQVLVDVGVVVSSLSPATAAKVSSIDAQGPDAIVLRLRDGSRVMWGSAEESDLKSDVIDELLELVGSRFDVSAPSHPARR